MFLIALIASALSAGVWLFIIRCYDRLQPEPIKTMLWVGLAGGFLATLVAGIFNDIALLFLGIDLDDGGPLGKLFAMAAFVGLNEEVWKAFFTILLLRKRKEVDEPIDGMIYAMTASLGFAAFENIHYMLEHGVGVIVIRSLLSVPAHLACGAIWGYGYSKARFVDRKAELMPHVLPWVLFAAACHAAYDFPLFTRSAAVLLIIPLLIWMCIYVHRRLRELAALHLVPIRAPRF